MEIFTKNSAKCTVFQSTICNKFSSLMVSRRPPQQIQVARLIHTILAHSSTSLYLSIFRRHRTRCSLSSDWGHRTADTPTDYATTCGGSYWRVYIYCCSCFSQFPWTICSMVVSDDNPGASKEGVWNEGASQPGTSWIAPHVTRFRPINI
jgi:hypothetical protein